MVFVGKTSGRMRLRAMAEPTQCTTLQRGRRLDITFGSSLRYAEGVLKGLEVLMKVDLDGLAIQDQPRFSRVLAQDENARWNLLLLGSVGRDPL